MECGCVTKYKGHPWPTDGATRKFVDRKIDKLANRIDRVVERVRLAEAEIKRLTARESALAGQMGVEDE